MAGIAFRVDAWVCVAVADPFWKTSPAIPSPVAVWFALPVTCCTFPPPTTSHRLSALVPSHGLTAALAMVSLNTDAVVLVPTRYTISTGDEALNVFPLGTVTRTLTAALSPATGATGTVWIPLITGTVPLSETSKAPFTAGSLQPT